MVLGKNRLSTTSIFLVYLYGAALRLQNSCNSLTNSSEAAGFWLIVRAAASVRTMNAFTTSSRAGSGEPTTADSTTEGWSLRVDSTSKGPVGHGLNKFCFFFFFFF